MKEINKPIIKKHFVEIAVEEDRPTDFEGDFQILRGGMIEMLQKADQSQANEDRFYEMYNQILDVAGKGYLPAQDYLGYLYKQGLGDLIPSNYPMSMDWQFMAGSNGNELTIDRLKIFFTRSYDDIYDMPSAPDILAQNDIYEDNATIKIGKLLCDAMVDSLGLKIEDLVSKKVEFVPGSIVLTQKYEQARVTATRSVIEYLKKSANFN